jgi:conjugative relaxase-like TrwC/TraI family protein
MLTRSKITSSSDAAKYYAKDNYYTKEKGVENSFWAGKGAAVLGLSGSVEADVYEEMLEGKVGEAILGRITKKGREHSPGTDFTFSAPKSLSIVSEIYGVTEIRNVHEKAVREAIKILEGYSVGRISLDGKMKHVKTNNIVIGAFNHDVSRELDPQLHTHVTVINATLTEKGWRSLENSQMVKNEKHVNRVYRRTLFEGLKTLGFDLRESNVLDEVYEIAGVPDEMIMAYSGREKQIKEYLKEHNIPYSSIAAKRASLLTRKVKENIAGEELHKRWQSYHATLSKQGIRLSQTLEKKVGLIQSKEDGFLDMDSLSPVSFQVLDRPMQRSNESVLDVRSGSLNITTVDLMMSDWIADGQFKPVAIVDKGDEQNAIKNIRTELVRKGFLVGKEVEGLALKYVAVDAIKNINDDGQIKDHVVEIDSEMHSVIGKSKKGLIIKLNGKEKTISFSNIKKNSLYIKQVLALNVGERVQFVSALPNTAVKKGFYGQIAAIDDNAVIVQSGKKQYSLPFSKPLPFNYAYTKPMSYFKNDREITVYIGGEEGYKKMVEKPLAKNKSGTIYMDKSLANKFQTLLEKNKNERAVKIVEATIYHLIEKDHGFTVKEIVENSRFFNDGGIDAGMIKNEVHRLIGNATLLPTGEVSEHEEEKLWTNRYAIELEKKFDELLGKSATVRPIVNRVTADSRLARTTLNDNQKIVGAEFLSSTKQINAIQGDAGVGKTYTMKIINGQLKKQGFTFFPMAPTNQAAEELKSSLGIASCTVDRFLIDTKIQKQAFKKNTVWLVDETGLLSIEKAKEITELALEKGARVLFVGDHQQLESVCAGRSFQHILQAENVAKSVMNTRIRQKNKPSKKIVDQVLNKEYGGAIRSIEALGNLHRGEREGETIEKMVADFGKLSKSEQDKTLLVAPTNEQRKLIDNGIRVILKENNVIAQSDKKFSSLIPAHLTEEQKKRASNYTSGQKVRFNVRVKGVVDEENRTIEKNNYYRIINKNEKTNILVLKNERTGNKIAFNPEKHELSKGRMTIYDNDEINLAKGDKIRWLDDSKSIGVNRNTEGLVQSYDGQSLRVQFGDKSHKLDVRDLRSNHIGHAYTTTAFGSQGKTSKRVMALMEGFRRNTVNQRSFMVALTRATDNIHLYSSDTHQLEEGLRKREGNNRMAIKQTSKIGMVL